MKPWLGQVLVVLLLLQWGGGLGSCLARMAWDPAQALCHLAAPADDAPSDGQASGSGPVGTCPVCAPLPPSLPAAGADVPPPRPRPGPAVPQLTSVLPAVPIPPGGPQQARAPPLPS